MASSRGLMTEITYSTGDNVEVRDPDGEEWLGIVSAPSVLWSDWYHVRHASRRWRGRTGKKANDLVHASEMKKLKGGP
jgi:hypothetical protein